MLGACLQTQTYIHIHTYRGSNDNICTIIIIIIIIFVRNVDYKCDTRSRTIVNHFNLINNNNTGDTGNEHKTHLPGW